MFIKVVEWKNNRIRESNDPPSFYLEQDNWNDYSFFTSYALHISGKHTEDKKPSFIGALKILKKGQVEGDKYLVDVGNLEALPKEFCSMANSLDYYERIAQLDQSLREQLLLALRDLIIDPSIKEEFMEEPGYRTSLMRYMSEDDDIFEMAPLLISRNFSHLLNLDLKFEFKTPEFLTPIEFNFSSPTYGLQNRHLPNRVAVVIGRNGSGKSTLLSRIARIAYSPPSDRSDNSLLQVGEIFPKGLGFPRIILLSYSAFDAFQTPGIYKRDKETIVEEIQNGLGRFVFCGVRDIVAEIQKVLPDMEVESSGKLKDKDIKNDRVGNTIMKPLQALGEEFCRNLETIHELQRQPIINQVINILSEEVSMRNQLEPLYGNLSKSETLSFFMGLSTGHKFVVHALSSIIAISAPRSILLFDEPETHLHPPILATMMKAIRYVLEEINAFMIVATHSPVVLQETLRENVYIVRREGDLMKISQPNIQTFGENTGVLTSIAFGLSSESTDFHHVLDSVIQEIRLDYFTDRKPEETMEEIEKLFTGGLSMQARAYVLSQLYPSNQ